MREIITAFIIVFTLQIATNNPPLPEAQATNYTEKPESSKQAPKQPEKKRVVKHATPKKKTVRKPVVQPRAIPKPQPVRVSGTCADWIRSAGIKDVSTAHILIMKESTCNPNAVNPSSGACGLGQQLPCGKWAHTWNEPVGALKDMNGYVMARYGSWANALNFHLANNWY